MSEHDDWLPPMILLSDHGGQWNQYSEALYQNFSKAFVVTKPTFRGQAVSLKRHPMELGKECTFWHLIQEGSVESERVPNIRRCERIDWPAALINAAGTRADLKIWRQVRGSTVNILIALADFSYKVVLAERSRPDGSVYLLMWTAYPVDRSHQRNTMAKEWQGSEKA